MLDLVAARRMDPYEVADKIVPAAQARKIAGKVLGDRQGEPC
jgi:hypothetical protein